MIRSIFLFRRNSILTTGTPNTVVTNRREVSVRELHPSTIDHSATFIHPQLISAIALRTRGITRCSSICSSYSANATSL